MLIISPRLFPLSGPSYVLSKLNRPVLRVVLCSMEVDCGSNLTVNFPVALIFMVLRFSFLDDLKCIFVSKKGIAANFLFAYLLNNAVFCQLHIPTLFLQAHSSSVQTFVKRPLDPHSNFSR